MLYKSYAGCVPDPMASKTITYTQGKMCRHETFRAPTVKFGRLLSTIGFVSVCILIRLISSGPILGRVSQRHYSSKYVRRVEAESDFRSRLTRTGANPWNLSHRQTSRIKRFIRDESMRVFENLTDRSTGTGTSDDPHSYLTEYTIKRANIHCSSSSS